ncbi:MAG: restriction endonuclease subunit S [Methylococcales symbiont of Hymedesmia sp. n. MRB-2018]|nr:MAG: restriction endonuclease subunit S [Methylococcales symbiont of Hymedesmia sp. n. MRB-2018]
MKYGLSAEQLTEIKAILSSYDAIEQAILFGSRAIDTYKEASDVDIAIKGEKADWSLAMTLKDHFEEETYLPFFFDVVAYSSIKSDELREHIDRKGKVLCWVGRSEWREVKISGIAEIIGGGTPKTSVPEYWNGDIPWLSVVDFNTGKKYVSNTEKTITSLGLEKSSTKLLKDNDIIISARGTVGVLAMLDKPMAFNQSCYGMRAKENTTSDYLYYLLKNTVKHLQQASCGAVFDTITRNTFDETDIPFPPLPEQKAIAQVLGSLDDKIALLHRQNKTLEQMAETLFRQWFVEEAGEDWEEKPLKELVDIAIGRTPPRKQKQWFSTNNKNVKWISIKDMRDSGLFIFDTSEYLTTEAVDNFNIPIIPKNTVVLSFKMTLGRVGITSEDMLSNEAIAHFKFNDETLFSKEYLYLFLKTYPYQTLGSTSSIVTSINSTMIKELTIPIPDKKTLLLFGKQVNDSFLKIKINQTQIRTLESLRDTLLPKLMSGEVRVKI